MDLLKEIEEFLSVNSDGCGDGSGSGCGHGIGDGCGHGCGDGIGDGCGHGHGCGSGIGSGIGSGRGIGIGIGIGSGSGRGLKSFNNMPVIMIDDIPTVVNHIAHGVLYGYLINKNMTLKKCVVVKSNNLFAHGETIKKAILSLREKILDNKPEVERIAEFWNCHNKTDSYPLDDFFRWHHILTGSCEMGRKQFAENRGINLNSKEKHTVEWFVELTKNSYGGDVIKRMWKKGE